MPSCCSKPTIAERPTSHDTAPSQTKPATNHANTDGLKKEVSQYATEMTASTEAGAQGKSPVQSKGIPSKVVLTRACQCNRPCYPRCLCCNSPPSIGRCKCRGLEPLPWAAGLAPSQRHWEGKCMLGIRSNGQQKRLDLPKGTYKGK